MLSTTGNYQELGGTAAAILVLSKAVTRVLTRTEKRQEMCKGEVPGKEQL